MMNIFDLFEDYRRRYAIAMAGMPVRRPWVPTERDDILAIVRKVLGVRDEWVPSVNYEIVRRTKGPGFTADHLVFTSWPGVTGTANLYLPDGAGERLPAVLLGCGHGAGGKLYAAYQCMAQRLAALGAAVLVPDNIGQGERAAMGHADCVVPFACGLSVQGLIVMETMGWLELLRSDARFGADRVALIGNSGGGTLALFAGALAPGLAAVVSSGYPSTFDFIALKEKKHCHCNILPGMAGAIEMWQVFGSMAPRPLLIFQGEGDPLFPVDLFHAVSRRVRYAYTQAGAAGKFRSAVVPGGHPWDAERIALTAGFLADVFELDPAAGRDAGDQPCLAPDTANLRQWPADALGTDALARQLVPGVTKTPGALWDVFPVPEFTPEQVTDRGDARQIAAQMEAFLAGRQ